MSWLPPITACWDSAPPEVNRISSSRPYLLKMPARWPSSATPVSHRPRCGTETRTFRWPRAGAPTAAQIRAASASTERKLGMGFSLGPRASRPPFLNKRADGPRSPKNGPDARGPGTLHRRRNLDHLLDLRRRERPCGEPVLERIRQHQVEPANFVRPQRRFGKILVADLRHQFVAHVGKCLVHLQRGRVRIHPVEGVAIALHEARNGVATLAKHLRIRHADAHRLIGAGLDFAAQGDHADLAFLDEIESEWRGAAADVDLPRHRHCQGGWMSAGGNRARVNLVLVEKRKQRGVARRAVLGIADGLAGPIGKRLDRAIPPPDPVSVRRAD